MVRKRVVSFQYTLIQYTPALYFALVFVISFCLTSVEYSLNFFHFSVSVFVFLFFFSGFFSWFFFFFFGVKVIMVPCNCSKIYNKGHSKNVIPAIHSIYTCRHTDIRIHINKCAYICMRLLSSYLRILANKLTIRLRLLKQLQQCARSLFSNTLKGRGWDG